MKILAMQNIKVRTLSSHRETFLIHFPHVKLLAQRLKTQRKSYLWHFHEEFNVFIDVWTRAVGSTSFAIFVDLEEGSCFGQSYRCPQLHLKC